MASSFVLDVRAALDATGRHVAPARWTVERGVTVGLEQAPTGADVADTLLLPGLVNAHAHLDLGGGQAVPAGDSFPDWLLAVGAARQSAGDVTRDAEAEARDLAHRGVVAIGDIDATGGRGTAGRRRAGVAGVGYLEVVGVRATGARQILARALDVIDRSGGPDVFGLSPHAPYSLHEDVLPEVVRAARRRGLRLAMHLAESEEETRYLLHGDGPFVGFLETIGKGTPFRRPPGVRPVAYAEAAGLLAAGGLVVHGNDLDDDDVERLGRHGATVVYCHGTHRHFERPTHRWLDLRAAGARLAVGTDSGISNDGVDLFAELERLCRDRSDIDPLFVLEAACLNGREALGLDPGPATFAPGSPADGLLLEGLPDALPERDRLAWAFGGDARLTSSFHAGRRLGAAGHHGH